jgi:phospholipase C
MSFYDWEDLPFYYELAEKFAISDRQFSSVLGPTLPNRSYLLAATSFGLTANEFTPPGGYNPTIGTIFDLLNAQQVSWADYFETGAQDSIFQLPDSAHNLSLATFFEQAAGVGPLPQVAWIDPAFSSSSTILEDDQHPPSDIQRGQSHISDIVNAVRSGPHWEDSIILITFDEHGGFYDHVHPPHAGQDGDRTPDGIFPRAVQAVHRSPIEQNSRRENRVLLHFRDGKPSDCQGAVPCSRQGSTEIVPRRLRHI